MDRTSLYGQSWVKTIEAQACVHSPGRISVVLAHDETLSLSSSPRSLGKHQGVLGSPLIEPDPHITMHEDPQCGALPRVQWVHDSDLEASQQLHCR